MSVGADILPAPAWLKTMDPVEGQKKARAMSRWQMHRATRRLFKLFAADRQLTLFERGSYRRVFAADDVVYKVPNPKIGAWEAVYMRSVWANVYEACQASDEYEGPIAPCRIVWHESGLPVVIMERLGREQAPKGTAYPEWGRQVDNQQYAWSALLQSWAIYDADCIPGLSCKILRPPWW